jgi:hypothetical protein
MSELGAVLDQLKRERSRVAGELEQLDQAIRALDKVGGSTGRRAGRTVRSGTRTMSAAARKRIAIAQKARWAKFRASKGKTKVA